MNEPTSAVVAPVPVEGTPAPAPSPSPVSELEQFRARRAEPTPVAPSAPEPVNPLAGAPEPPEAPDEPESPAQAGPEPAGHRWKDPDTGVTLDLRRRDHRRIKRVLEDRADLARQVQQYRAGPPPEMRRPEPGPPPQAIAPDPTDPEPSLEQFADQADPYLALARAQARWEARQEFRHLEAQRDRVERSRRVVAQIDSAQSAWDAKLPDVTQRYPDFDAAYRELFGELTRLGPRARPFVQYLLSSSRDIGHDVAYYLGQHPEEVQRLFAHPTAEGHLRAIGAIEARVRELLKAHAPARPVKPAPAPIAPVGGRATPTTYDPRTADLATFRRTHGVRGGRRVSAG